MSGLKTQYECISEAVLLQVAGELPLAWSLSGKGCHAACVGTASLLFPLFPLVWLSMTASSHISTLSTILFLLPGITSMLAARPDCEQLCWACCEAIADAGLCYRKGRGRFSLNSLDSLMTLLCFPCSLGHPGHLVCRQLAWLAL